MDLISKLFDRTTLYNAVRIKRSVCHLTGVVLIA